MTAPKTLDLAGLLAGAVAFGGMGHPGLAAGWCVGWAAMSAARPWGAWTPWRAAEPSHVAVPVPPPMPASVAEPATPRQRIERAAVLVTDALRYVELVESRGDSMGAQQCAARLVEQAMTLLRRVVREVESAEARPPRRPRPDARWN